MRSIRKGGLSVPHNQHQQEAAQPELGRKLLSFSLNCQSARGLQSTHGQPHKKARCSSAPESSPLAYQQALLDHSFPFCPSGIAQQPFLAEHTLPELRYFQNAQAWRLPASAETLFNRK